MGRVGCLEGRVQLGGNEGLLLAQGREGGLKLVTDLIAR